MKAGILRDNRNQNYQNKSFNKPKVIQPVKDRGYLSTTETAGDLALLRTRLDLYEYYNEGKLPTDNNMVYIGTLNNNSRNKKHLKVEQTVKPYTDDRANNIGKVLNPEARKEDWSYARNQAFMLGAIEAKKSFKLVTPVDYYHDAHYVTQTFDELLWIADNGYTFTIDPNDKTMLCTPPVADLTNPVMNNYNNGDNKHFTSNSMLDRTNKLLQMPIPLRPWQKKNNSTAVSAPEKASIIELTEKLEALAITPEPTIDCWKKPLTFTDSKPVNASRSDDSNNWRARSDKPSSLPNRSAWSKSSTDVENKVDWRSTKSTAKPTNYKPNQMRQAPK